MSAMTWATWVPTFTAGVRFRYDEVRRAWVILAPERLFVPDEQGVAVLQQIDGQRTLDAIVDELATKYQGPREMIAADVAAMLRSLIEKQVLRPAPAFA